MDTKSILPFDTTRLCFCQCQGVSDYYYYSHAISTFNYALYGLVSTDNVDKVSVCDLQIVNVTLLKLLDFDTRQSSRSMVGSQLNQALKNRKLKFTTVHNCSQQKCELNNSLGKNNFGPKPTVHTSLYTHISLLRLYSMCLVFVVFRNST